MRALQVGWGWYLAGCAATAALIVAYFAAAGALGQFGYEAFLLGSLGHPVSRRFLLIQDLPEYLTRYDALVPALMAVVAVLLAFRIARAYEVARTLLLAGVLAFVLVLTLRHPPPPSRPLVTIVAYGVLVSIGLVALVTTVALEGPWLRNNATAQALRRGGASVWLAGRPATLETELTHAGVSAFIFAGCDVLAALRTAYSLVA